MSFLIRAMIVVFILILLYPISLLNAQSQEKIGSSPKAGRLIVGRVIKLTGPAWFNTQAITARQSPLSWLEAYENMPAYSQDQFKLGKDSEAKIQFKNRDFLTLFGNSTILLTTANGKEEVNLLQGEAMMQGSRTSLKTLTARTVPTKESFFKVKVQEDGSAFVQVEKGEVEVTSLESGKRVLLGGGFSRIVPRHGDSVPPISAISPSELKASKEITTKLASQPPPLPQALPAEKAVPEAALQGMPPEEPAAVSPMKKGQPELAAPTDLAKWKRYRLQVAQDEKFRKIEREYLRDLKPEKRVEEIQEEYQLPNGTYFRRVFYIDEFGNESKFFKLPDLRLNTSNPFLSLEEPEEGLRTRSEFIPVKGKSESGKIVTVNDKPVEVKPDGSFYWGVVLTYGANKIKVVAKDLDGNVSYLERTVYFKGD